MTLELFIIPVLAKTDSSTTVHYEKHADASGDGRYDPSVSDCIFPHDNL